MKCLLFLAILLASTASIYAEVSEDIPEVEAVPEEPVAPAPVKFGDGLTDAERAEFEAGQTQLSFQTDTARVMDIIIHSLYSKREVFMRELISNAADALDKIRFIGLTDKSQLGEGAEAELDIKVTLSTEAKTITLTDKGVGMSREDLINNLGTIAKSDTAEFLAASTGSDAMSLIGQFGVGFYSVYLVADKVTVISKKNGHDQHIWESTADSVFTVGPDPRGNTLGRGTSIVIHLKEDASEFLEQKTVEGLIQRYSQFINFPIYIHNVRTETKQVEDVIEEDKGKDESADDDLEVTEEEDEPKAPKYKDVTETITEWKRLNEVKAIWTRNPKDIEENEYQGFYESITANQDFKLRNGFMDKLHFTAEGEISFRALLYIPKQAASNLYNDINTAQSNVKLYVRRVLIADKFDDFLPRFLSFLVGVVDSDDLPLNVSRETLAQNRVLQTMSKKIVRKVLESLRKIADDSEPVEDEGKEGEEKQVDENADDNKADGGLYGQFWEQYANSIKLGVIDDKKNRNKLAKLLRYQSSKSDGKLTSIENYVDRMGDEQKVIYYITGESMAKVVNSPFLEKMNKKGIEVLYLVDPIDEYVVQAFQEFDGIPLQSVTKKGLKIDSKDEKYMEKLVEAYKPLISWMQNVFGKEVKEVTVSDRIEGSPCVVVTDEYGWSANMERIMKAQALGNTKDQAYLLPKKTLEINPRHPIIRTLRAKIAETPEDEGLKNVARLLLDSATLASGFTIQNTNEFAQRIDQVVRQGLSVPLDAPLADEATLPEPAEPIEDSSELDEADEAPSKDEL